MKTYRLARVAEAIREVASETILFEMRDPRVKRVTVTRAEVSGDLQHAKVYVSVMGAPAQQKGVLKALQHGAGFVQAKVANRLQTRFTPLITFVLDEGVKRSIEMTRLIDEALGRPPAGQAEHTEDDATAEETDASQDAGPAEGSAGPPTEGP